MLDLALHTLPCISTIVLQLEDKYQLSRCNPNEHSVTNNQPIAVTACVVKPGLLTIAARAASK